MKIIKKIRVKINTIEDFKNELNKENYNLDLHNKENFNGGLKKAFNLKDEEIKIIEEALNKDVIYVANNVRDFIKYINNIILFEKNQKELLKKIVEIKKLIITRVEYERVQNKQEDVCEILKDIEELKKKIDISISNDAVKKISLVEEEISRDGIYTKDVELLKKIIGRENAIEKYDSETMVKTLIMDIPENLNPNYIKAEKGSIEYHNHIENNIQRIKRLIKNLDKYLEICEEKGVFKINQTRVLQDTINIAVGVYDNKEFKAVSGSNEIKGYCIGVPLEKSAFKSRKVNKLGKLGVGYNRVNDSEKKIIEEIHKQIEKGNLKDNGTFILYSKWEPCPSCYSIISQFSKKYPNIKIEIESIKKYGEK